MVARLTAAQPEALDLVDEADLIKRAKARDPAAWTELYDSYYGFVFRYALGRLRQPADAEDIAAQVFLEALKGIGRYHERGRPLLAWFYAIARNLVAMRFRSQPKTEPIGRTLEPTTEFESSAVQSLILKAAIDQLTEDQREVIVLRFLTDLPTRSIAAMLGKKEATIYALQVRGIASLRRQLRPK